MEIAATIFYLSMSFFALLVGACLFVFLIVLIKTLKIIHDTASQVRSSVTNFEVVKKAIASGITAVIENFIGKKFSKGGGKHVVEK